MLLHCKIGKTKYFLERTKSANLCAIMAGLLMLIASSSFAQSYQTEVEIIQDVFGLEKKVAVSNFMNLPESSETFWKIYDKYEVKRKKLGKERIQIIADYASSYPNLSDKKLLELFKRTQAVKKSFDKLQKSYFKKMKRVIGTSKAAQFWQLEGYFSSVIQAKIYTQIPFIGEHKKDN